MPKTIFIEVLSCDWLKDNQMVEIIGQFDRKEGYAIGFTLFSRGEGAVQSYIIKSPP